MGNFSWQRPGSDEEEDQRATAAGTGDAAEADDLKVAGPADEDTHDKDTHDRFGDEAHREQSHETPETHEPVETYEPVESHEPVETHEPVESHEPVDSHETSETHEPVETPEPVEEHESSEAMAAALPVEDDKEDAEHAQSTPGAEQPVEERLEQFMDPDAATSLRERWRDVQSSFVDDPKLAVEQADELASEVLTALSETLTERKNTLDGEWRTEDDTSDTEKLRLALRGYRDFFDRMLSI